MKDPLEKSNSNSHIRVYLVFLVFRFLCTLSQEEEACKLAGTKIVLASSQSVAEVLYSKCFHVVQHSIHKPSLFRSAVVAFSVSFSICTYLILTYLLV